MFKKFAIAALVLTGLTAPVKAEIFDYVQLWGGVTMPPNLGYGGAEFEMDNGFNVGGQLGWNATDQITAGFDMMFTQSEYGCCQTHLESFSMMATGTYYFDLGTDRFRPYAGAGLGLVHVTYDGDPVFLNVSGSEYAFGWQLMAGASIPTRFKFDLQLGYRYQWADDVTIAGASGIEYQSHNLTAGFLFKL